MNLARVRDFLAAGVSDHTERNDVRGRRPAPPGCCVAIDGRAGLDGADRAEALVRDPAARRRSGSPRRRRRSSSARCSTNSVRLHLRSDVPVGSCLSGGLDSSSIVCLMGRMLGAERRRRAGQHGLGLLRREERRRDAVHGGGGRARRRRHRITSFRGRRTSSRGHPISPGTRTSLSARPRSSRSGACSRRRAAPASR